MRVLLKTILLIFVILFYERNSFALSDYQIREICRKDKRKFTCIKDLQEKRLNLLKGNRIEIPVEPFKK